MKRRLLKSPSAQVAAGDLGAAHWYEAFQPSWYEGVYPLDPLGERSRQESPQRWFRCVICGFLKIGAAPDIVTART